MISIKSNREIENMKIAGRIVKEALNEVEKFIKPGITTLQLDKIVNEVILKNGATPSFLGLYDFPNSACISVNEQVVHGIPSKRKLKEGDIVTIDAGACYNGMHADSAWTFPVGKIDEKTKLLLERTEQSLKESLKVIKPGNHIGDIGNAIETYISQFGYGIYDEICGHGIGSSVHEDPQILNTGNPGKGKKLKEGMTFCVEPMICDGTSNLVEENDGWTLSSFEKDNTAHFEYTILVTKDGYEILN